MKAAFGVLLALDFGAAFLAAFFGAAFFGAAFLAAFFFVSIVKSFKR